MSDRLKASELLGRSEADFTDKIQGTLGLQDLDKLTPEERKKRLDELRTKNG